MVVVLFLYTKSFLFHSDFWLLTGQREGTDWWKVEHRIVIVLLLLVLYYYIARSGGSILLLLLLRGVCLEELLKLCVCVWFAAAAAVLSSAAVLLSSRHWIQHWRVVLLLIYWLNISERENSKAAAAKSTALQCVIRSCGGEQAFLSIIEANRWRDFWNRWIQLLWLLVAVQF